MSFLFEKRKLGKTPEIEFGKLERLKKLLALFLLFLLFAFPLLTLQSKLMQIQDFRKAWSEAEEENILREEMSEFKNDFDSESFLTKFLQRNLPGEILTKAFIKASIEESPDKKKQLFHSIFTFVSDKVLNQQLNFKPLFVIVSDESMYNTFSYFSDEFLKKQKIQMINGDLDNKDFLSQFFLFFSFSGNSQFFMPQNLVEKMNLFVKKWHKSPEQSENSKYFYKGVISTFVKEAPYPGKVNTYFSDIFGFQNILYYTFPVLSNNYHYGSLTIAYLDNQFYDQNHLSSIPLVNRSKKVKRFFVSQKTKENLGKTNKFVFEEYSAKLNKEKLKKLILGVKISSPDISRISKAIAFTGWLIRLLCLMSFTMLVRIGLFDYSLPMPLRLKLMGIFFLAISIPAIAGGILFFGIFSNHVSVKQRLAKSHLETKLNMMNLSYQEAEDRQVLNNLFFKYLLVQNSEIDSLTNFEISKYKNFFGDNIHTSFIYNRKGESFSSLNNHYKKKIDSIKLSNSIFTLKNISGLIDNPKTKKDLKKLTVAMGFADKVLGLFDFSAAAGSEGENIARVSDINSLSRSEFFLFPDMKHPFFPPNGVGFFEISSRNQFSSLLVSKQKQNLDIFNSRTDIYDTELALALRDSLEIHCENWLSPALRHTPVLSKLFQTAMNTRSTGEANHENSNNIFYAWRFQETIPLIFAGITKVNQKTLTSFYLELAPWLLGIFCLLALILVSEIVSNLFLSPIKVLSKGLKQISETGDFNLSVEIHNNDEFDQLGSSFNAMTRGLMMKKHISRFVSKRLLNEIENEREKDSSSSSNESEMTILASDIRDFTTISENNPPELVVNILNNYFTIMESCILSEGGIIEKFIGDAIIAIFTPDETGNSGLRACRAAVKMREAVKDFNKSELLLKESFEIENGIGITTGRAIVANLGKNYSRKFFTIIGELPDSAENLEALTKSGSFSKIIIDLSTRNMIKNEFKTLKVVSSNSLEAYEIMDRAN